jgi:hypothetical protein
MSAFSDAQKLFDPKELGRIIALCADKGIVYSDSAVFFCAYPMFSGDIETQYKLELDIEDTWFIFIASGELSKAFDVIPKKEYISFERFDGNLRVYKFDRLRRLIHGWNR